MSVNFSAFRQNKKPKSLHQLIPKALGLLLFYLFSLWRPSPLLAEGARQLAPSPNDITMLLTSRVDFSNFAAFDGPADSRLHITIADPSEVVYLGLTSEYTEQGTPITSMLNSRYRFRIKRVNPDGADPVVHGPFLIDNTNANVSGWDDAVFGAYDTGLMLPNPAKGNQLNRVFEFLPGEDGDYYIEFQDYANDGDPKVLIGYWDITVALNGTPVNGRVWSRNWALRTPVENGDNPQECGWDRKFNGTLYSYTADGFVSKIDFTDSGFQGLAFTVAFNTTGPGDSGDFAEDRKSIPGVNATNNAAQHRIFLNEPDPAVFPDGECGTVSGAGVINCDGEGNYCLDVSVTRAGQVDIILDFNQNGRFDPESEDVILVHCFEAGGPLNKCITWDGMKGDGSAFEFGEQVDLIYVYTQGVQNWAVYDGEFMKNGFCVEAVRPQCGDMSLTNILYWDDRNISEAPGTNQPRDGRGGCECRTDNCRTWTNFNPNQECTTLNDDLTTGYGDKSTLNTWWFAGVTRVVNPNVPILTCQVKGPDVICEGESTVFKVEVSPESADHRYRWEGPGDFSAEGPSTGNISAAGTYCVTVTDEQGCETVCCRDLRVNPMPVLECSATPVSCFGGEDGEITSTAGGGGAPYEFSLDGSNFQASGDFSGLAAGVYTVTVRDAEGCSTTCDITVTQPEALSCGIDDILPVSCAGDRNGSAVVSAAGGNGDYTYQWDNGETTAAATQLSAGIHEVTVTDAEGCSVICSVNIEAPNPLTCSITNVKKIRCDSESNGQATVVAEGGNGGYTYLWDNGETTATATQLKAGLHEVTVTDAKGCSVICSVTLEEPAPLTCEIIDTKPINCLGEATGRATAVAAGGNGSYNFQWDNGETGATATMLSAGTHTVTVTDGLGCTSTCTVDITAPLEGLSCEIIDVFPVGCQEENNGSATVVASGGNGGYTYLWDNGETTATATMLSRGDHSVTVTDELLCTTVCTVKIGEAAELACYVELIQDVTCKGDENGSAEVFPIGGVQPYTFEWDNGETTKIASNLSPGIHQVTVTDATGCTTTCDVRVSDGIQAFACWAMNVNDASCEGADDGALFVMTTGGVEPFTYEWSNGAGTREIKNLSAGSYSVTVTDANGCRSVCAVDVMEPKVSLVCPAPLEVSCSDPERDAKIAAWLNDVDVLDSCDDEPLVSNDYDFQRFNGGDCRTEQVVTFSHQTPTGRIATCEAVITLKHEEAPEMICPPDLSIDCSEPFPAKDFAGGSILSACGLEYNLDVEWVSDDTSGQAAGNGEVETISRTYQATDNCGNTASCTQTIQVTVDTEAPNIETTGLLAGMEAGSTLKIEADFQNPDWNPIFFTAEDITASDENQPVDIAFETVLLEDLEACGPEGYLQRRQLIWTATDACGQEATFSVFLEVVDTTPPAIAETPEPVVETTCDAIPDRPALSLLDNGRGGEVHYEQRYLDPVCDPKYRIARIWTPIDGCGNEGETFTQVITVTRSNAVPVMSVEAPQLQGLESGDTLTTDCAGLAQIIDGDDLVTAQSVCSRELTLSKSHERISAPLCTQQDHELHRVTWLAKDECGWNSTFVVVVKVTDQTAPRLAFREADFAGLSDGDTVTVSCGTFDALSSDPAMVVASDDCGREPEVNIVVDQLREANPCTLSGSDPAYRITWRATDQCDNRTTLTLNMIIVDNTPPTIHNLPADTCAAEAPPVPDNIYATDDCGGEVSLTYQGERREECFAGGTRIIRTWVAYDRCGNSTRHEQYITYDDNFAPYMRVVTPDGEFIGNGSTVTLATDCHSGQDYGLPELMVNVFDFCQSNLGYETEMELLETGDCLNDGFLYRVRVSYSATDNCGNTGTFSFIAALVDNEAPVFDEQSLSRTVACDAGVLPTPLVIDCDPNVTLTLLDSRPESDFCADSVEQITRLWEATDACGNTSTAEQVLLIGEPATESGQLKKETEEDLVENTLAPQSGAIKVYPNPSYDEVFFNLSDFAEQSGRLRIINLMGHVVYEAEWDAIPTQPVPVDLSNVSGGVYTVTLRVSNNTVKQEKFIVSK